MEISSILPQNYSQPNAAIEQDYWKHYGKKLYECIEKVFGKSTVDTGVPSVFIASRNWRGARADAMDRRVNELLVPENPSFVRQIKLFLMPKFHAGIHELAIRFPRPPLLSSKVPEYRLDIPITAASNPR